MTLTRYLHLVAMACFVGGKQFLVAAVVPRSMTTPTATGYMRSPAGSG